MPIHIRSATPADLPALERLFAARAAAHTAADPARYSPLESTWPEYCRALSAADERHLLWLVAADPTGALRGYLLAEHIPADPLVWSPQHVCIHDLLVDPAARRSGAARALVQSARDWTRQQGAAQLRLFTDDRNDPARAAFSRLGFRRTMVEMTLDL